MWYAYIYGEHHKAKKGRVHSRRQKGQQGARKGQQGVAPCYLHLAGPLYGHGGHLGNVTSMSSDFNFLVSEKFHTKFGSDRHSCFWENPV